MADRTAAETKSGSVKRSVDVIAEDLAGARGTRIQVLLGPEDGAPNFVMRRISMEDIGSGMPAHTNAVEHEQFVLCGRARIGIGDREFEVGAEDTVYIPAGTPHWYDVLEAPFEFLCVVPNREDRVQLVEQQD